jgi:hypothetical protein
MTASSELRDRSQNSCAVFAVEELSEVRAQLQIVSNTFAGAANTFLIDLLLRCGCSAAHDVVGVAQIPTLILKGSAAHFINYKNGSRVRFFFIQKNGQLMEITIVAALEQNTLR